MSDERPMNEAAMIAAAVIVHQCVNAQGVAQELRERAFSSLLKKGISGYTDACVEVADLIEEMLSARTNLEAVFAGSPAPERLQCIPIPGCPDCVPMSDRTHRTASIVCARHYAPSAIMRMFATKAVKP